MIIITGATGNLGREVVQRLVAKVGPEQVGASVRSPEKASNLQELGVRVRHGDFKDSTSLQHAFEGASQVLIISINSAGGNTVEQHRNAIEAAKAVGAERILYTSHMGANRKSLFAPMVDHAATEELLADSGVAFTSLHNGFYAESALPLLGQFLQTSTITAPQDGPVSWTARTDLADAAVIALTDQERLNGITPPLTRCETLDLSGIAALASEILNRDISRVMVADEQYREASLSRGLPGHVVDLIGGLFGATRQGEFTATDSTLEQLLGRTPMSMREVLAGYIETTSKRQ